MKGAGVPLAAAVVCAVAAHFTQPQPAAAVDVYWLGGDSNGSWHVPGNWSHNDLPRASASQRAVIGTDNPSGDLMGSAVFSQNAPAVGGVALGIREFDFDDNCPGTNFCNPQPEPGTLVGKLTITGGTLNSVSTPQAFIGADGRVLVGVQGRGYLTMTGGTLNALQLVVSGEQGPFTAATQKEGVSYLNLSGNATVNISNPTAAQGLAVFERSLVVTGPNVNFSASGNIRLTATNTYTANITGTAHSPLKTNANIQLGGNLVVNYSGAPPAMGQTWDLFDFGGARDGNFSNLGPGGDVPITGVPATVPGEVYRLRQVDGGTRGKLYQIIHDSVLVLEVNRDTGEMSITNPVTYQTIPIDGYQIQSRTAGSLLPTYKGISGAPAGDSGWLKPPTGSCQGSEPCLSSVFLGELKPNGVLNRPAGSALSLGNGFDKHQIGADPANFGIHPEDLVFHYTFPGAPGEGWVRGHVVYVGEEFSNNLVLRVNPTTGEALLENDTLHNLSFDGYTILSSTGALSGANWNGIGGGFEKSPASGSSLTETNLTGDVTLAAGASVNIGRIGNFSSAAAQDGLSIQFIRTQVPGMGAPDGDFNGDGVVDAADYTVWRDSGGSAANYNLWKANFGATGGLVNEETFRAGMVRFDLGAGAGSLAGVASVPEPGTALLMFIGLGALATVGCRRGRKPSSCLTDDPETCERSASRGGAAMFRQISTHWPAVLSVAAALVIIAPAAAQTPTQGIPLTNWNFNQPGGGKVVPFDASGNFVPGLIPGWTFSGPGTEVRFNAINPLTGQPFVRGDSSTEPGGSSLRPNPGNHLTLADPDGTVYQTVPSGTFTIGQVDSNKAYRLTFDANDFFTIDDSANPMQFTGRAQFQASIYYEAVGGNRVPLATQSWNPASGGWFRYELEFPGPVPSAALGRPIGVELDVTSVAFNQGTEFNVAHSWIGFDNVLLEIAGLLSRPGDLDGNGVVNMADYDVVRLHQQQSCLWLACGDLTRDGITNLDDFRAIKGLVPDAASGALGEFSSVPEPSTAGLALLVAAMLSGTMVRRRGGPLGPFSAAGGALAGICAVLACGSQSSAELWYYDPFLIGTNPNAGAYVEGPLAGQNPVMNFPGGGSKPDFFSGAWQTPSVGQSGGIVHADSISFIGTPSLGGSVRVAPVPDPMNPDAFLTFDGRTGRFLTPSEQWTAQTEGTFFLSFLANFGTTTGGMGYRSVEFWPVGNTVGQDAGRMDIGYNQWGGACDIGQCDPNTARMQLIFAGQRVILEGAPPSYNEDGLNHLIVFRFDLSAENNADRITVFLNPTTPEEPEQFDGRIEGVNFTWAALGHVSQFGGETTGIFDELRVGTTFDAVLPSLPCAGGTRGQILPACQPGIDMNDFETILENFGRTNAQGPPEGDVAGSTGRIGSDGRVDLRDFRLWKDNRTDVGTGSLAGAAVPEPASWILAVAAALALGCCRRRRQA